MNLEGKRPESKGEKLLEELRNYALISVYLFICFAVILLYDLSVQDAGTQNPLPWGIALVKALVLGKFILIGDALSVGSRARHRPLLHRVAWKSVAMLAVLVVFKILEELIVGWVHGETPARVFEAFIERTWIQDLAPLLLMLLIMIPMIAASEIYRAVDAERFRAFLMRD